MRRIENNKEGVAIVDHESCDMSMLVLDEDGFGVGVKSDCMSVDLGGIGKGYAVDVIEDVLKEWGITKALISAGASSVKAMEAPDGKDGWKVTITNPADGSVIEKVYLCNEVLSSSGIRKGFAYNKSCDGFCR